MPSHTDFVVKEIEPRTVAYKGVKGSFTKVPDTIGEVVGWITQRGLSMSGPPVAVYFDDPRHVPEEELAWEIQWPVSGDPARAEPDEQGIGIRRVDAYDAAVTLFVGPYEQVGPVYDALIEWVTENGYRVAGPPEEVYLNDPNADPRQEPLTEIRLPVTKK